MGLITSTGDFLCMHHWGALPFKLRKIGENKLPAFSFLIFVFFLASSPSFSQGTGPCDGTMRWSGGAHWNLDGTIDDRPNAPQPNGIIRCGSSAETQSNILPYNNTVYTPGVFEIDVESGGGCVDPSTGILAEPKNPTPGELGYMDKF
ncbi:hypothetical protein LZ575_12265 [Antarcticibacterium sp. 1MA-6-2]|uniref:hypothetical protein n=1 Tax=Antarcticibacterium sp. 1MA-6-2 TaxID=2908210 RepID=UPI001F37FAD4|nr:hypothetical protein [Antarcticibacterium sp. 1MA-6-2]UJH89798.1 hypothetical protein LZ575_12265 [Antarcticibacterium sp. 1MA-6-2]